MKNTNQKIMVSCPICKKDFPIDDAIKSQLIQNITKEAKEALKEKEEKLSEQAKELEAKQKDFAKRENKFKVNLKLETEKAVESERIKIKKEEREKAEKEVRVDLKDKEEQIKEKEKALKEAQQAQLDALKKEREADEKIKNFDLELEKQLKREKDKLEDTISRRYSENFNLKEHEYQRKINDLLKQAEELKRKAEQGSQQFQGEVQELDLEDALRSTFPDDHIEPIEKFVHGADVKQIVKTQRGANCGVILWESKNQKIWQDQWIQKIKDDLRRESANIPVIMSLTLPKEIKNGIGSKANVWICSPSFAIILSEILRQRLIAVEREKVISNNKESKASLLYEYITSHEFIQQVQAMVEVYQNMQEQVQRERTSYEKTWKTREEQIKRMFSATANIVGAFQGKIGSAMPIVKGLELLESGENKKE